METIEVILELIRNVVMFGFAAAGKAGEFILGLGFPMSVIAIVLICVVGFLVYQQLEHMGTSSITAFMISAIIVIAITFGLVTFILPAS